MGDDGRKVHTFLLADEPELKLPVSGIPHDTLIECIQGDLTEKGFVTGDSQRKVNSVFLKTQKVSANT